MLSFIANQDRVWDPVVQRVALGRFGWKANTANIEAQVVGAANGDLGLSSATVRGPNCAPRQRACLEASKDEGIELDARTVRDMTTYLRHLAPPAPRNAGEPAVERGRVVFDAVGCTRCHRPALPLGTDAPAGLGGTVIAPYTDLLLHDMGAGLADGRPDFLATGRQWRTPPLWGLGLVATVNEHTEFLHDGRARNLREAIAWHDGEARRIRRRFERLPAADQAAVLRFLESL